MTPALTRPRDGTCEAWVSGEDRRQPCEQKRPAAEQRATYPSAAVAKAAPAAPTSSQSSRSTSWMSSSTTSDRS